MNKKILIVIVAIIFLGGGIFAWYQFTRDPVAEKLVEKLIGSQKELSKTEIINRFGKYIVRLNCHGYEWAYEWTYEWVYEEGWLGIFEGEWKQKPVEKLIERPIEWHGSGIIYNTGAERQTIILTNYHVIEGSNFCNVEVFDPIQGRFIGKYKAVRAYFPRLASPERMREIDFSFLKVGGSICPTGRYIIRGDKKITDSFPHICKPEEVKLGKEIVVLGYPGIGGIGITALEGIISSFEHPYLVTTAKLEHGNSGGGAFLKTGCLIGMPTWVEVGRIEALGRMINLPWLKQNYLP